MEKKITQKSSINHFTLFYFEKATIFQIAIKQVLVQGRILTNIIKKA